MMNLEMRLKQRCEALTQLLDDPAHSLGEGLTPTPKPFIKGNPDPLQVNLDTSQT